MEKLKDTVTLPKPEKSTWFKNFFSKKFNIYSFLQLAMGMILFTIMIFLIVPEISEAVKALNDIAVNPDEDVMGYDVILHLKPFFSLFMYTFQIFYCLYGIIVLYKYQNERQVFKIIFRNIFYISTVLFVLSLMLFVAWLFAPIKNFYSIMFIFMTILILVVVIVGRLVSNFSLVNMGLKKRKLFGYITVIAYMLSLIWTLLFATTGFGMEVSSEPETLESITDYIFYSLQIVTSFFSLGACYYFTDDSPLRFEQEPKIKKNIAPEIIDLPLNITELGEHSFSKNTRITRAIIPDNIKEIGNGAFSNCLRLRELHLPNSLKKIDYNAFFNCQSLKTIIYNGTKAEFKRISLTPGWLKKAGTNVVHCNNGQVVITD